MHWTHFWLDLLGGGEGPEWQTLGHNNHAGQKHSHPIQKLGVGVGYYGGMLQWRQMIPGANILLLLRGSPLSSVCTQLCSVPRIQNKGEKPRDETDRETQQKEWGKERQEAQINKALYLNPKVGERDERDVRILGEILEHFIWRFSQELKKTKKTRLPQKIHQITFGTYPHPKNFLDSSFANHISTKH